MLQTCFQVLLPYSVGYGPGVPWTRQTRRKTIHNRGIESSVQVGDAGFLLKPQLSHVSLVVVEGDIPSVQA